MVHMVRCPFCTAHHRMDLKLMSFGVGLPSKDLDRFMKEALQESFNSPIECPVAKKSFTPDEDDWIHLTEEEFHSRFPGHRSN
jgi:hypothetical protein